MSIPNNENQWSRRAFIRKTTTGGIAAGLGLKNGLATGSTPAHDHQNQPFGFASQPVLANVETDQIEVIVVPNDLATGQVEVEADGETGRVIKKSHQGLYPTSDRVLRFRVTGLKPGSRYQYRIRLQRVVYHNNWRHELMDEAVSNSFYFRTLDPDSPTVTFACWNDTHENAETIGVLNSMLQEQQPDFLVWNGDVTNDIFREKQIVGQFLKPAGQAYATSVPLMLARGNHDVRGRDARYVRNYITGPNGSDYYAFRQGPLACLVMDTGEDKPDDHHEYAGLVDFDAFRSEQARWLAGIIEKPWFTSAPFRVVFQHIPLVWEAEVPERWPGVWGEGIKGWISEDAYAKWHDLFVKAGIQLVISGHTHRHAYFAPNSDRPYGQLIGGGPDFNGATSITGRADNSGLKVKMTDLNENILEEISIDS